ARSTRAIDDLETAEKAAIQRISAGSERVVDAMFETSQSLARDAERITRKTRWQRDVLAGIVIAVTFFLGMRYDRWVHSPPPQIEQTVTPMAQQPAAPVVQPRQQQRKR